MKKLSVLISSIFAVSFLAGCNSQPVNQLQVLPPTRNPQVKTMSEQGLIQVNRAIGQTFFTAMDTNKDGFVTAEEYNKFKIGDNAARFKKVDKNSDKKISLDEMMMNRKNFLPDVFGKESLRSIARFGFDFLNKDKDSVVSQEEFLKQANPKAPAKTDAKAAPVAPDPATLTILNVMFNLADKNADNELSFSEYEDYIYAGIKGNPNLIPPTNTTDNSDDQAKPDPKLVDPFKGQPGSGEFDKPILPDDKK